MNDNTPLEQLTRGTLEPTLTVFCTSALMALKQDAVSDEVSKSLELRSILESIPRL